MVQGALAELNIFVTENGNVGIGVANPTAKLDVWGNFNVATGTLSTFRIDTGTGVVGIGNDGIAIGDEKLRISGRVRATGFDTDLFGGIAEEQLLHLQK
jgi:hypothetical protein